MDFLIPLAHPLALGMLGWVVYRVWDALWETTWRRPRLSEARPPGPRRMYGRWSASDAPARTIPRTHTYRVVG